MSQQQGGGGRARSRLNDGEERLARKVRQTERGAADGIPNGLVQIFAELDEAHETEIRNIALNVTKREHERDEHARILDMAVDEDGLWIETESEKHAQHIANAIARARNMNLESTYNAAGKQRILSLRPKST